MLSVYREPTESAYGGVQDHPRSLFLAGISFRNAPVALREQLAVAPALLGCQNRRLMEASGVEEVVLLSTCNRVEIYGAAKASPADCTSLLRSLAPANCDLRSHAYVHQGADVVAHLFTVASGLDSMVLGETEITGQVKQAYEQARAEGVTGRILNQVFQKALQTAKEIRTHTGIGRTATSVGSVAVEVAERILGQSLRGRTALVLGAGQMGERCMRHLAKKGAGPLLVANRSSERARAVAAEFGGQAVTWAERLTALVQADIAIVATGFPHWLLTRVDVEALVATRGNRPLVFIDVSVPRNIDPAVQDLENIHLCNIDDLEGVVRQNVSNREQARADADEIIARSVAALLPRLGKSRKPAAAEPDREMGGLCSLPFNGSTQKGIS